jgi:hypothetical protein
VATRRANACRLGNFKAGIVAPMTGSNYRGATTLERKKDKG